jgi:Bacterial Ig-like domain (group 3)/Abnormal spindle-like microcephaly-assoc'd, ASPM-SPD-2-Hydin
VGETSNNQSVLFSITNNYPIPCAGGAPTCGAPLIISSITPGLPDYTVSAGGQSGVCAPFPVTIPVGSNCTFSVIFTPVAGGLRNTTLTIQSNDPQGTMQLPVYGAGLTLPLGEFLQTALNFGNCAIGVPCPALTTALLNGGQSNLAISAVNASANFAIQANTCTGALAPQATCTITVTFTPPSAGFFSGTLTVTDNDQFGSQQSVTLTGTGATGQQLRLMPPTVNFGDQSFNTTSEPRTITLTSTGDTAVTFPANAINTTPDFLLESTTCTGSLPTGSSCTANVQFKPTDLELEGFGESGSMKATDGAAGSPQLVYMQGTGTEGTTAASTTTLMSSINPSASGEAITFMAAVAGPSGNSTLPTGTVNFLDGSAMIGSGTLNGRGIAAYPTSSLSAGSHSITAVYGGDANFNGSTSNLVTQVVNSLTVPTITWNPAQTIVHGGAGGNVLNASANTGGSFAYSATPIAGGAPINITGGTAALAVGSYNLTANFTPANTGVYDSTQATATLLVSGESVWIVNGTSGLSELAGDGYGITSSADPGANLSVAFDSSGNVWTVGSGSTLLEETNQAGTALNTISSGTGGLNTPAAIAIDGNGQIWIANGDNSVSLFSNGSTALSPATGFIGAPLSAPSGVAVDLSGSVWITNKGSNSVTRILGAAAPAAPLSTAAANQTTGEKP